MIWLFILKYKKYCIIAGIILLLIIVALFYRVCHKPPHINEKEINNAQQAIAKEDRKEMERILVDSDVREQAIDDNVADAEQKKEEVIKTSKEKVQQMTNQELADELHRRLNQ